MDILHTESLIVHIYFPLSDFGGISRPEARQSCFRPGNATAHVHQMTVLRKGQVTGARTCSYASALVNQNSPQKGRSPLSTFCHHFNKIRRQAGIETGTFHDLRRTCLSNWIAQGLSLHEVKELAGHAGIETTERFYLAVRKVVPLVVGIRPAAG